MLRYRHDCIVMRHTSTRQRVAVFCIQCNNRRLEPINRPVLHLSWSESTHGIASRARKRKITATILPESSSSREWKGFAEIRTAERHEARYLEATEWSVHSSVWHGHVLCGSIRETSRETISIFRKGMGALFALINERVMVIKRGILQTRRDWYYHITLRSAKDVTQNAVSMGEGGANRWKVRTR